MTRVKSLAFTALGFTLGLATFYFHLLEKPAHATAISPDSEYSYLCFDASSAADVNQKVNTAAARGWRVAAASPGTGGSVWCMVRNGPSPLREKE